MTALLNVWTVEFPPAGTLIDRPVNGATIDTVLAASHAALPEVAVPFGVYATVDEPGPVAVGDDVTPLDA